MAGTNITLKAGIASDGDGGTITIESGKPSGVNTGSNLSLKTWASSGDGNATERLLINSSGQITICDLLMAKKSILLVLLDAHIIVVNSIFLYYFILIN
jgi:hypothetical protein